MQLSSFSSQQGIPAQGCTLCALLPGKAGQAGIESRFVEMALGGFQVLQGILEAAFGDGDLCIDCIV